MRQTLQCVLSCLCLIFFPAKANITLLQELTPPFSEQAVLTLTTDSFVIKSASQKDTEIWHLNSNTQTLQSWLQFNAVFGTEAINPVFFSANAGNWWAAGISEEIGEESPRFVHVAHYKADGSANYVKIPAHTELGYNSNPVNRWLHLTELDTLVGVLPARAGINQLLMLCHNASNLQSDNCTFHLIPAGELFTAGKYLLLNEPHSLNVYRADTALTLLANYPNVSTTGIWPGATRVQLSESIIENSTIIKRHYELDITEDSWPKTLQLSRFNSNFNSQRCIFYRNDKALCKVLTQLDLYSWQPEQQVSLKFEYYGPWEAVPSGELLTVLEDNKFVIATDNTIRIYEMVLPTHAITNIPEAITLFVNDDYRLNQAELFEGIETSDIEFTLMWESDSSTVSTNILIPLNATTFKIDTSKDIARQNPKGVLQFSVSEGLWTAFYNIPLVINNINAAPIALAPAIQLPLIEIGETYQLTLFELFNDPDLDPLIFTQSTLPAGFTRFDNLILVTPTQSGRYSFTVTATDPAGLSATVQLTGEVKAVAKTEEKKSGGSLGVKLLTMLLLLLAMRPLRISQLERI